MSKELESIVEEILSNVPRYITALTKLVLDNEDPKMLPAGLHDRDLLDEVWQVRRTALGIRRLIQLEKELAVE